MAVKEHFDFRSTDTESYFKTVEYLRGLLFFYILHINTFYILYIIRNTFRYIKSFFLSIYCILHPPLQITHPIYLHPTPCEHHQHISTSMRN